ncbi:MAG: hypothetical protein ACRENA_02790 [Vulcanimicrobiaceae bacterium]
MRVTGCSAATMRAAASVLAFFFFAPLAASAAPRTAPSQQLEEQMRTTLMGMSQTSPFQAAPPQGNTLRTGLTERFNGSIDARIFGCNQQTATAIADALAPHISSNVVDDAMSAWERYDVMTGGHPIGVRVGLGKEFLGYANGQNVEDRWVNFHVTFGLFGPHHGCRN